MRSTFARGIAKAAAVLAGAFASGLVTAIGLAIADLYVTGHGGSSLMRRWLHGVIAMSRADVILYAAVLVGGGVAWLAVSRMPAASATGR